MVLPNFLGLGAQRAATTWAYDCLRRHPDVFLPGTKELAFFNRHHERGLDWYAEQFAGHAYQKAVGEITPGYLGSRQALRRIAETLPGARLFVILREPIGRAFSAYQLLHEHYRGVSFREACLRPHGLVESSLYAEALELVLDQFPSDRVRVLLYDDVLADPSGTLAGLFEFLGVDPSFQTPAAQRIVNRIVLPGAQVTAERLGLGWGLRLLKRTPLAEAVKQRHRAAGRLAEARARASCPAEVRARFHADIDRVEALIGRDLSHWR